MFKIRPGICIAIYKERFQQLPEFGQDLSGLCAGRTRKAYRHDQDCVHHLTNMYTGVTKNVHIYRIYQECVPDSPGMYSGVTKDAITGFKESIPYIPGIYS
jgi:hypothetical protein